MATDSEWRTAWDDFFESIGELVEAKLNLRQSRISRPMRSFLGPNTAVIIRELTDQATWPRILLAIRQYCDPNHQYLEDILYNELRALALQNRAVSSSSNPTAQQIDEAAEDSETGKDSIEKLVGNWLPDWVLKLLDLLNEVLKFIRGG